MSIPMSTRSSDVRSLAHCPGGWALKHSMPDEMLEATFFEMGTQSHWAIEQIIVNQMPLDAAIDQMRDHISQWLANNPDPIESRARPKGRITDIAERHVRQWWRLVHPDSPDRLDVYKDYDWPPKVETEIHRSAESAGTQMPIWGTIDGIFTNRYGDMLVVDWKSGARSADPIQLNFYRYLLDRPDARAAFHYMDRKDTGNVFVEVRYPGNTIVRNRILDTELTKRKLVNGRLKARKGLYKPSALCSVCPAMNVCPIANRNQQVQISARNVMRHLQPVA